MSMASLNKIDSHIHIVPPFYNDAVIAAGAGPTRGSFPEWSPERGIAMMDAHGIEVAITSIVPGIHFLPPQKSGEMARRCNEFSADLAARYPDRYGAFGMVPMHEPGRAIEEIAYALDVLKLDGLCMFTSYGEKYLGDAIFDPVLDALNKRNAVVFTHPFNSSQQLPGSPKGSESKLPYPAFMIEYPFDTTRMAAHLMFSGAIERFPQVRFILSHAGGTLPFIAWRLFCCQMVSPHFPKWSEEKIHTALRHFWYDTAMATGREMLTCLLSIVGPERLVFGSDWPLVSDPGVDQCLKNLSTPDFLTAPQQAAIARGNALKLFPRLAK
jgi:predicted TIM-barrel fold metal-dependent hydrolase